MFLGGVAVGKNGDAAFGGHRGFEQMMPGYGQPGQSSGQMPFGQNGQGGQMPYGQGGQGQGGQGWGDSGTSPHGWGQGGHDWDEDGGDWGDRQPGQQGTPSPAPSIQTQ